MAEAAVLRFVILPALLVLGLALAALVLGRRRPAFRHRAVVVGLAAASLLPWLSAIVPAGLSWSPPPTIESRWPHAAAAARPSAEVLRGFVDGPLDRPSGTTPEVGAPAPGVPWLIVLAAAGAVLILGRRLLGAWLLARLARRARPAPGLGREATRLAARLGLRRPVELMLSEEVVVPVTWGCRRPRVALPAAAETWPVRRREAVLLHELAHVRRGDSLAHWALDLAEALYWWNPLVWWLTATARGDAELASDALAVEAGVVPADYARELLAVLRSARGQLAFQGGLPFGGVAVSGRIEAICRDVRASGRLSRTAAAVALGVALVPAAGLAALRPAGPAELWKADSAAPDTPSRESGTRVDLGDRLRSPSPKVWKLAVSELADPGDPALTSLLLDALEDPSDEVRQAAATALGELDDPAVVPALLGALGDGDSHVRQAAADSLGALADPRAVPALADALSDRSEHVRQGAARALGRIGRPAASRAGELVVASRDGNDHVRQAAVAALGRIADPGVRSLVEPALVAALDDPNPFVRRDAVSSLAALRRAGGGR